MRKSEAYPLTFFCNFDRFFFVSCSLAKYSFGKRVNLNILSDELVHSFYLIIIFKLPMPLQ